ncbi:MAG: hypothetical protein KTR28_09000 [Micavibrio sp.]|nr:hypothetical protein [Micavibrio sp.]
MKSSHRVTIRFKEDEYQRLEQDRGKLSISAYIRQKLFGDGSAPRKRQYRKTKSRPDMDAQMIAKLLGTFGQSELATSMLALALAAQTGDLDVTPDVSDKLEQACDDIHNMRTALILALGVKPQGEYT